MNYGITQLPNKKVCVSIQLRRFVLAPKERSLNRQMRNCLLSKFPNQPCPSFFLIFSFELRFDMTSGDYVNNLSFEGSVIAFNLVLVITLHSISYHFIALRLILRYHVSAYQRVMFKSPVFARMHPSSWCQSSLHLIMNKIGVPNRVKHVSLLGITLCLPTKGTCIDTSFCISDLNLHFYRKNFLI